MDLMEKIVSLCKRRGFVYPGSELYGGLNGTWDLGPLGSDLARNIKYEWWQSMVASREDVVGLNSSILHHTRVWEASGHIASFTDSLIECKKCHTRFREDQTPEKCNQCEGMEFTSPRQFNTMFKTHIGPVEESSSLLYLRPETAQGIFINYQNVLNSTRVNIPFGIAQVGKGFRNEITTGNFLFRVREFEMMELEFFIEPGTDKKWHEYWKENRLKWFINLGIRPENVKVVDLPKEDIAHYSKGTAELWYNWPFMGFGELEGIANRGDYDLTQHSKLSGRDLTYTDKSGNKYLPIVIEPSVGVGRAMLAFLVDAYTEAGDRIILKLHPKIAPFKVAVFPLLANKPDLVDKARAVYQHLKLELKIPTVWDDRGNIGKRYYAQDEIGTPWCVTVDFQTLSDATVTVRERDNAVQNRLPVSELDTYFTQKLK
ncbi:MAG: Glycine-tRNA ligase [Candidatus Amesbacteria bacterium GW2011_GWB1_47_19]|nr:MAG: Glycine-tRNA ligase [Candidatus Amesbacteria bacterium GW2011_GWA1_44_24]KKU30954.1 MAG: Glycine-tRNA ligase [Candidatus Amesbacteria bacterium GW2011_GWC1_46_24]KKU66617.1 MAG: Glycine-tRNA ligase [Candidatus Amesbacteria bacterium GW2011_GWB1_47_19]OGD05338.1 MAG: glycine--tRNA ligase [Candidatus Amesbacteria bacterium RIFOXYB1_FULL_47_13]HBC73207.1 glycine--tRNA ligase [Candidatus Amesbacteria bacterium]